MSLVCAATLEGHTERVWHVAWSPCGNLLASCSGDKTVRVWRRKPKAPEEDAAAASAGDRADAERWECVTVLEGQHSRTVRRVAWRPDGSLLAASSFDASVSVWQKDGEGHFRLISELEGYENEVKGIAWSQCGALLASCSRDKTVWIWDVTEEGGEIDFECEAVLSGHKQDVKSVAWSPAAPLLASCSYDDSIRIWVDDDADWGCIASLTGHESTVWDVAFHPSGRFMASCSADKTVKIWEQEGDSEVSGLWQCVCTISGYHRREIYSVSWNARMPNIIACGGGDDIVSVFSQTNPSCCMDGVAGSRSADPMHAPSFTPLVVQERAHASDINCVAWSPSDATLLATCGDDEVVKLWRLSDVDDVVPLP